MKISWHEDLATGDSEIDAQHKDLLRKVDDLLQAVRQQRGREELGRLIWFLKRYVRKHFRDEEKLQAELAYPGLISHRAEHQAFFNQVRNLEQRYARDGANTILIVNATQMMCRWIKDHFHKMDKEMVEFVRATRIQEGAED